MRGLIEFFVNRTLLVNMITVGVIVAGSIMATMTTRALLPPEKVRRVEVTAVLPGASAVDMERFVTFRLEEALQGMEHVDRITSTTTNGRTAVVVRFTPDVDDLTKGLENVRSRLSALAHRLPKDLEPLRIQKGGNNGNFTV